MRFEFATATRIVFGRGAIGTIGVEAAKFGRRPLVVGGKNRDRVAPVLKHLEAAGLSLTWLGVAGEPRTDDVESGVALSRSQGCDCVIGIGGGSAMDAAKAIAAMLGNPGELLDYLEVIGRGRSLPNRSIPFIAVPTTAGTGAEVTRNAVLSSPGHKVKVSLRSPGMLAALAIVDPDLTAELAPPATASTGMDALTQLLEAFVSAKANPMTDALCRDGLRRCSRSLLEAFRNGGNMSAREDMSLASLFSGLALANAGLGAVHGFAGPIGGMFPAPHGAVCAALLPHVMTANIAAIRARAPGTVMLEKFDEIARLLTGSNIARAEDGIEWVRALAAALGIPSLKTHGLEPGHIGAVVEQSMRASSMKANPILLERAELEKILQAAL